MLSTQRLRYRTDRILEVVNPSSDGRRPLEWRRSFNSVSLEARSILVEHIYQANDPYDFASIRDKYLQELVKPDVKRTVRLVADIDFPTYRHGIYFVVEEEKGSGIYKIEKQLSAVRLFIVGADASDGDDTFKQGSYPGVAFHEGDDRFGLELHFPRDFVEEVASQIKRGEVVGLSVCVSLLTFSDQLDDAPRDLLVHGTMTSAALVNVKTIPYQESREPVIPTEDSENLVELQQAIHTAPASVVVNAPSLTGVKVALWAIALVLLLSLFK